MKFEFEKSIERLTFLCCLSDVFCAVNRTSKLRGYMPGCLIFVLLLERPWRPPLLQSPLANLSPSYMAFPQPIYN